jgi:hypothetical protein
MPAATYSPTQLFPTQGFSYNSRLTLAAAVPADG